MFPPPPRSTLFPYTTLFRSRLERGGDAQLLADLQGSLVGLLAVGAEHGGEPLASEDLHHPVQGVVVDRKSTRLNSSHLVISYAVFCLKKKKKQVNTNTTHEA